MEREYFKSVELEHGALEVPINFNPDTKESSSQFLAPHELQPEHQELVGQRVVLGKHGHGSIRNEEFGVESAIEQAEQTEKHQSDLEQEKAIKREEAKRRREEAKQKLISEMLDPSNILDLKAKYDHKVARQKNERTHNVDKTHDKDGSVQSSDKEIAATIKEDLVTKYTQTGVKPGSKRRVRKDTISKISEMMDMSYEDLENLTKENSDSQLKNGKHLNKPNYFASTPDPSTKKDVDPKDNSDETSIDEPQDWTKQLPDISTRVVNQAEFDASEAKMTEAILSGDEEKFDKAYRFLSHEIAADRLINGTKHEKFEEEMNALRKILEANKKAKDGSPLPPPVAKSGKDNINRNASPIIIPTIDYDDQDNDEINDLPPIIIHDDDSGIDDLVDGPAVRVNPSEEPEDLNEKKSKRKVSRKAKIAAGALALLATGALLFGLSRNDGDSNEGGNEPATTTVEEEVELLQPSDEALAQLEEIDAESEASESNDSAEQTEEDTEAVEDAEASNGDSQALKVAIYEKFGAQIDGQIDATDIKDLDASEIAVSSDVMPWTNVVNAGAENPDASIRANLALYNQTHPENQFEYRDDGMFWSVSENRIINPEELKAYNELMKLVAETL